MIVYGDPCFRLTLRAGVARIARLAAASLTLERARTLLIAIGEIEQAAADALPPDHPLVVHLQTLIMEAARLFVALDAGESPDPAPMQRQIDALAQRDDIPLTIKVPEGFAFYTLYPDQYLRSARAWRADHPDSDHVLVIGLRSIGTTLSAAAAAALERAGCTVTRVHLRPDGHPFERTASFDPARIPVEGYALVVDEGPGMSGSSMAAVADALERGGLMRSRIVFMPGHSNPPGSVANEKVRAWWEATACYPASAQPILLAGQPLIDHLRAETIRGLDAEAAVEQTTVDDLSGGGWRRLIYRDDDPMMPPAFAPFAPSEYHVMLPDGRGVVWTFAGTASAPDGVDTFAARAEARLRARHAFAAPVIGETNGFVGTQWGIQEPLSEWDRVGQFFPGVVGAYIELAKGEIPDIEAHRESLARLREMTYWNIHEGLGEAAANQIEPWLERRVAQLEPQPTYGDGRMHPALWNWVDGRLVKRDAAGHDLDHTVIGMQSILWDVAGVIEEWEFTDLQKGELLTQLTQKVHVTDLTFYQIAYRAFILGMCKLCLSSTNDEAERTRLLRQYQTMLDRIKSGIAQIESEAHDFHK